jgi:hypothetical protein
MTMTSPPGPSKYPASDMMEATISFRVPSSEIVESKTRHR